MSDLPSARFQQSEISDSLNSTMMGIFLFGIYTMVYVGTLYAYLTRAASQRRTIIAAITVLYLLSALQFALQWWLLQWQFIEHGDTQVDIFLSYFTPPEWFDLLTRISMLSILVLADGLLIWRCFHVWRGSFRVLAVPLFLWVSELSLSIALLTLVIVDGSTFVTEKQAITGNDLLAAVYLVASGDSLVTTILIGYRIYSVSNWSASSTRRFGRIVDIVVQSSALYSLALLSIGIAVVLPGSVSVLNLHFFALNAYLPILCLLISGLAPTIMVARVALLAPDITYPSAVPQLSVLQFRGSSSIGLDDDLLKSETVVGVHDSRSGPCEVERKVA